MSPLEHNLARINGQINRWRAFEYALAGAAGFVVSGWGRTLPAGSFGFVYLPALAGIVLASFPMAKVGAAAAHRLPAATLKKVFAAMLVLVASRMLAGLL